jgi:hypothetical protein
MASAQKPGDPTGPSSPTGERSVPDDTLFIFQPARPLIDSTVSAANYEDALGIDVLFSNSGFGLGGFYNRVFSQKLSGFVNLAITGSRKRDEFERYIQNEEKPDEWEFRVPDKVNRVYTLPLTLGLRYRLFDQVLVDNFRPYANVGIGPSLIVALPYEYEFFSSFGHAETFLTAGGFVGVGADFGGNKPMLGVNIRYYYIPFKTGVESTMGDPITEFGGLFLTMNIGFLR